MEFTGKHAEKLHIALYSAYDLPAFRQMVRFGLDHRLEDIVALENVKFPAIVFETIEFFSRRRDGIHSLLAAAHEYNPANQSLAVLIEEWKDIEFENAAQRSQIANADSSSTPSENVDPSHPNSTSEKHGADLSPHIDQRSGTFFDGNESIQIDGDLISGGTVNKHAIHGDISGDVHIHYDQLPKSGSSNSFFLAGAQSWATDFFRLDDADEHGRTSWAGMAIYMLRTATERVSGERFLAFLTSTLLLIFSIWFIGPLLTWPQFEPSSRLSSAVRFVVASLFVPLLVALLTKPDGAALFAAETKEKWRTITQLKLSGAFTGFGAFSGIALFVAVSWFHLFGQSLPQLFRWLLIVTMLFFTYVSARRIPLDRYKMFEEDLKLHEADPLFLAVFLLFGPFIAGMFYFGHPVLINRAAMVTVLLGCVGLTVWELRRKNPVRFSDPITVALLGLLIPSGFLLLFFFDIQSALSFVGISSDEVSALIYVIGLFLSFTMLGATVFVRRSPQITLSGAFGLLAIVGVMVLALSINLWIGRGIVLGFLLLWYVWGRQRFKQFWSLHTSIDLLFALFVLSIALGLYTSIPIWVHTIFIALSGMLLSIWAYRIDESEEAGTG